MNKIQQLLTPPPQGVEYKKLGEVCEFHTGIQLNKYA